MTPANALPIPPRSHWTLETVCNFQFATAVDYAVINGIRPDTTREHLRELRSLGYVDTNSFGSLYLKSEPRWWVTTRGRNALLVNAPGHEDRAAIRYHMAGLGVMARRADVAALISRLTARLTPHITEPGTVFVHYFDSGPLDALIQYQGNRFVGVIYAGPSLARRNVWRRFRTLKEMPLTAGYLTMVLAPTIYDRNVFLNQISTLGDLKCVVSYTHTAVAATGAPWKAPGQKNWISYKQLAQDRVRSRVFTRDNTAVQIDDLELRFLDERTTPVRRVSERVDLNLPPLAKKLEVALGQWGMLARPAVMHKLGVSSPQLSGLLKKLRVLDLISTERIGGLTYYALSDSGISHRAAQDRCEPTALLDFLSTTPQWPVPAGAPPRDYIRSKRGSFIRQRLENRQHDDLVSALVNYLKVTLPKYSDYATGDVVPSMRSWYTFTPGDRLSQFQSALSNWRELPTDRPNVVKDKHVPIGFRPDAIAFLHSPTRASLILLLELEQSASTPLAWQDRLEVYMLYSLVRPEHVLPLLVVPSEASETIALRAQTRWRQAESARQWPVAITSLERLRRGPIDGPLWRVDATMAEGHSLLSLPRLLQRR